MNEVVIMTDCWGSRQRFRVACCAYNAAAHGGYVVCMRELVQHSSACTAILHNSCSGFCWLRWHWHMLIVLLFFMYQLAVYSS
jgi:hypothetical protein